MNRFPRHVARHGILFVAFIFSGRFCVLAQVDDTEVKPLVDVRNEIVRVPGLRLILRSVLELKTDYCRSLVFSPNGKYIAHVHNFGVVVRDAETLEEHWTPPAFNEQYIDKVLFSGDCNYLCTSSAGYERDQRVFWWNFNDRRSRGFLVLEGCWVSFAWDHRDFFLSSSSKLLKADLQGEKLQTLMKIGEDEGTSNSVRSGSDAIATLVYRDSDRSIRLVTMNLAGKSRRECHVFTKTQEYSDSSIWACGETLIVVFRDDRNKEVATIEGRRASDSAVIFQAEIPINLRYYAGVSMKEDKIFCLAGMERKDDSHPEDSTGYLLFVDVASGRVLHREPRARPVQSIAVSPDGRRLVTLEGWQEDTYKLRLWDVNRE